MSNSNFHEEFDRLIVKFSELLTGHSTPEVVEKIKLWSLYSHMNKTMPALVKHWIQDNPEAKEEMRQLFDDVQKLNQEQRAKSSNA